MSDGGGSPAEAAREALAQGLGRLLPRLLPGATGLRGLARLSAGATLETWSFDAVADRSAASAQPAGQGGAAAPLAACGPDGPDGPVAWPLILRRAPGGLRGQETLSLATEAGLLRALAEAEPALAPRLARVLHVLQPEDGLGDGFLMERIAGETIARKIQRDPPFAGVRPRLVAELGEALGLIHRAATTRLPALPLRPVGHTLAQFADRVAGLPRPNPVFRHGLRWLARHAPPAEGERRTLVHGDYRLGNVIVAPDTPQGPGRLAAVLDWEIAHLGDPVEDLAWITLPPWRFGRNEQPVAGLGGLDAFLAAYEGTTGWPVDRARLRWWQAAGSLRWGLGCAGMQAWFSSGRDPRVERAMIARRVSENELDLLQCVAPEGLAAGLAAHRATLAAAGAEAAEPGLIDGPDAASLVHASAGWLRETVVAAGGAAAFHARVAANALDLAVREWRLAAAARVAAAQRLAGLLGPDAAVASGHANSLVAQEALLCERIARAALPLDDPALLTHLWASTLDRIAIDQPAYASYARLMVPGAGASPDQAVAPVP